MMHADDIPEWWNLEQISMCLILQHAHQYMMPMV